jgi:hypothetical protein
MSLSLTYDEIRRELGRFLGLGVDFSSWDAATVVDVADVIRRGSRRFYYPEVSMLPEGSESLAGHKWSFLQDELSVSLAIDTLYHALPSDFVAMSEVPTIEGSNYPLEEVTESDIRNLINAETGQGFPQYYAVKRTDAGLALSYRIALYPLPTEALTLSGWYQFDPPEISSSQAPIVPSNHAETFLASMLAAGDEMFNLESTNMRHLERFKSMLAASILQDKMIGGPR